MAVFVEIEYHPYLLTQYEDLNKLHAEHNITIQAYGPLSPLLRHPTGGPLRPVLERIAGRLSKETGKEVDEQMVLFLWTMGKGVVCVSASSTEKNIQKIALAQTLPDLSEEEMQEIDRIGKTIHFRSYVSLQVQRDREGQADGGGRRRSISARTSRSRICRMASRG